VRMRSPPGTRGRLMLSTGPPSPRSERPKIVEPKSLSRPGCGSGSTDRSNGGGWNGRQRDWAGRSETCPCSVPRWEQAA
jgi:hypothetical protein